MLANFLLFLLLLPNVFVNVGAREVRIGDDNYTVVFDAGSSGTRVHVFKFNYKHDLIPFKFQEERWPQGYDEVTPGLGSYADDPEKAANSIAPLLHKAVDAIPKEARWVSHLQLGATTGLALDVGQEKLEKILAAVKELFSQERSSLLYNENYKVKVISGNREGAYMWVAMNYLLKSLGNEYSETVGVINLGGASVEMSYAVDPNKDISSSAPKTVDEYITNHELEGINYRLYAHSYLGYGQDAARAKINDDVINCILKGSKETYPYNGTTYIVSSASRSNFKDCKKKVERVLNVKAECEVKKSCTFDGVWNGGGGAGQDKLYLASAFFSTAQDVNIIAGNAENGTTTPADFRTKAKDICALKSLKEAKEKYPKVSDSNLPYICKDLVYQYILLTKGFGLKEKKEVTLIRKVKYNEFNVTATWALGSAIETVSDVASTKTEANNMFRFWSHAYTE